ncbi:MAG: hypothetical protein KGO02_19735 [Alphaproteobacteria bacterium]|nr:hypothetical protein [Alphaproteobacteria bacterium]
MQTRQYLVGSAYLVAAVLAATNVAQAGTTSKSASTPTHLASHVAVTSSSERASPRFKAGYQAACDYTTFGRPRDDFAYRNEPAYHAGWKAGFAACLNRAMMQNTGKPSGQLNDIF